MSAFRGPLMPSQNTANFTVSEINNMNDGDPWAVAASAHSIACQRRLFLEQDVFLAHLLPQPFVECVSSRVKVHRFIVHLLYIRLNFQRATPSLRKLHYHHAIRQQVATGRPIPGIGL